MRRHVLFWVILTTLVVIAALLRTRATPFSAEHPLVSSTASAGFESMSAMPADRPPASEVTVQSPAGSPDSPQGNLYGVVRRPDGRPVPGARVFLAYAREDPPSATPSRENSLIFESNTIEIEWLRSYSTTERIPRDALTTTADGRFSFTVKPGRYVVWAEHSDHGFAASPQVRVKSDAVEQDLALSPAFSISGRVRDVSGAPVSGVFISVQAVDAPGHVRGLKVPTDAAGRYAVCNLAPGEYRISMSENESDFNWFGTQSQNRYEAVEPVQVVAGSTGVDLVLRQRIAVIGTVSGATKYWVAADYVEDGLICGRGTAGAWQFDKPEFELRLHRPGRVVLVAVSTEGTSGVSPTLSVEAGETTRVALAIRSGRCIQGVIHDPQGRPLPKARVEVMSVNVDGRPVWSGYWAAESDVRGRFQMSGVTDGIAQVKASHGQFSDLFVRQPAGNADVILILPPKQ